MNKQWTIDDVILEYGNWLTSNGRSGISYTEAVDIAHNLIYEAKREHLSPVAILQEEITHLLEDQFEKETTYSEDAKEIIAHIKKRKGSL